MNNTQKLENFLTEKEIKSLSDWKGISLTLEESATEQVGYIKKPFFSHVIVDRWREMEDTTPPALLRGNKKDETLLPIIENIVLRLSKEKGIECDAIFRACINVTTEAALGALLSEAHVDHEFPHTLAILYLNDSTGDTLVYEDIQYSQEVGPTLSNTQLLNPTHRIPPSKGSGVVITTGITYHTAEAPQEGYRAVCIITFGLYKDTKSMLLPDTDNLNDMLNEGSFWDNLS